MFIVYFHTRVHASCSSGSLIIAIKQKFEHRFCATALLFYATQGVF